MAAATTSPKVVIHTHVAAWGDADHTPSEVSRYAPSSSDEDATEWDSLGAAAAGVADDLVEEDLEDENFSFFDAGTAGGGLLTVAKKPTDDRSLRSIGRGGSGDINRAAAAASKQPALSAAATAAAAARVRVAAASNGRAGAQKPSDARRPNSAGARSGVKDLAERERRARAAETRLRQQAEQQEKERARLAGVQAKAARLRAEQDERAAAQRVAHQRQLDQEETAAASAAPAAAARAAAEAAAAERPVSPDIQLARLPATSATPPRRPSTAPRRPPPDSPLRTSTLESKFAQLQQAVLATPQRKKASGTPQRLATVVSNQDATAVADQMRASLEIERHGTAMAKEAWREASVEEAGWAQELAQVRAQIKAAEEEDAALTVREQAQAEAAAAASQQSPRGDHLRLRRAAAPSAAESATAAAIAADDDAPFAVKWSDVGTPAEILDKKLRKYRAKMNSPELTPSKRKEYLSKIRHYSAKAAELQMDEQMENQGEYFGQGVTREGVSRADAQLAEAAAAAVARREAARTVEVDGAEEGGWRVRDRCHAGSALGAGTVRFVGQCLELAKGDGSLWAGVELDHPRGKHDGTVQGQRYFQCPAQRGVLLKLTRLQPLR